MKRYTIDYEGGYWKNYIEESEDGEFIMYDDYLKEKENNVVNALLADVTAGLKPGDTFYYKNSPIKYHFIKTFEVDNIIFVAIKYYGTRKQYWHYEFKYLDEFNEYFKVGLLNRKR